MTRLNLTTTIVIGLFVFGFTETASADHDYCQDGYSLGVSPSATYSRNYGGYIARRPSSSYYNYPSYGYDSYISPGWGFGFGLGSYYYGGHGYGHSGNYGYGGHSYGSHGYGGHGYSGGHGYGGHGYSGGHGSGGHGYSGSHGSGGHGSGGHGH